MISLVFMVAGMSSRFGGKPKQMAKVGPNNETLIEYSVNQALNEKFYKLYFITNSNTEHLFKNIFGDYYKGIDVVYVEQKYDKNKRKRPWGTTDALCSLIGYINEPFVLVNGDDIYGEEAFKIIFSKMNHKNINILGGVPFVNHVPENSKVNRGIIQVKDELVISLEEKFNISQNTHPELKDSICNINFIGLQNDVLFLLLEILDKFKKLNKNDNKIECLLPDNLNQLIIENKIKLEYFKINNKILGITNPDDEQILKEILNNNKI